MKRPYLLTKRGKVWYYRLAGEKTFHSTGQSVESKAHRFALGRLQQGQNRSGSTRTLREYASEFFLWDRCPWIRRQHAKGRSFSISVAKNRRSHLVNHIFPRFGDRPLTEIQPVEVEDWLISLKLANQTRNHILYSLGIVLREAKREGLLEVNPLAEVEPLGVRRERRDILTVAEVDKLFPREVEAFEKVWPVPYYGVLYALMVSSGMRSGEVRAALWSAVVWQYSGILILRTVAHDGTITLPKGSSTAPGLQRQRAVVLPERTIDLLRWWYGRTRWNGLDDLMFPGADGRPLNRKTVSVHLADGLRRAEIEVGERVLVPHCLRHTYNTRMKELLTGEIFEEFTGHGLLRDFTGHHSEKMTEHYDNPYWLSRLEAFGKAKKQIEQFWKKETSNVIER